MCYLYKMQKSMKAFTAKGKEGLWVRNQNLLQFWPFVWKINYFFTLYMFDDTEYPHSEYPTWRSRTAG